jgi:cytochrome c peroxidase
VDGLNWDLINDGIGNPKNVKSLLLSHRTPPVMSHGVRERAEDAVRSGIRYILFARRPEEEAVAIDEYLKSLGPAPSPALAGGKLPAAAERGRKLFFSRETGCASCHPAGLFTDMKSYDVGTRSNTDRDSEFDTPALVELWRTAPYLHDGSAVTLRELLTTFNKQDRHGKTSHLKESETDDLAAYLGSL